LAAAVFPGKASALAHVVPRSCTAPGVSVAAVRSVVAILIAIMTVVMAGLLLAIAVVPVASIVTVAALLVTVAAAVVAVIVSGEGRGSCQQAHRHQCRKKGFDVHVDFL
jgi:hypothetical protein